MPRQPDLPILSFGENQRVSIRQKIWAGRCSHQRQSRSGTTTCTPSACSKRELKLSGTKGGPSSLFRLLRREQSFQKAAVGYELWDRGLGSLGLDSRD